MKESNLTIYSIHKLILDDLGVKQVAAVIGGSMGGMLTLEYAYFGKNYIRAIVPIATSSRHSAWGISWGEAQRQSIYCDPKYQDGYYPADDPPSSGLGAARMSALLTYRSRDSFESRFGRNTPDPTRRQAINGNQNLSNLTNEHWAIHNDGHKSIHGSRTPTTNRLTPPRTPIGDNTATVTNGDSDEYTDPQFHGATTLHAPRPPTPVSERKRATTYFAAQSYLRYQGEKFVKRFDSNCYIAITRKLDTHDVSRHRVPPDTPNALAVALAQIQQPALVLGIESDGLFTYAEQKEIAAGIPDSRLRTIVSPEGHDAFLLQFQQVNDYILGFFEEVLPDFMSRPGHVPSEPNNSHVVSAVVTTSTFGEAEGGDMTEW